MSQTDVTLEKKSAIDLISEVLNFFAEIGLSKQSLEAQEALSKYFVNHFIFIRNDNKVSSNLQQFFNHLKRNQQKFPVINYSSLLEEPIFEKNKIVIRFNADFSAFNDRRIRANIIAIITIEKEKISQWNEVLSEHDSGIID